MIETVRLSLIGEEFKEMFLRVTTKKSGDKTYHYATLVESYKEEGVSKHKTICNIGAVSEDEAKRLKLLFSQDYGAKEIMEMIKFYNVEPCGDVHLLTKLLEKEMGKDKSKVSNSIKNIIPILRKRLLNEEVFIDLEGSDRQDIENILAHFQTEFISKTTGSKHAYFFITESFVETSRYSSYGYRMVARRTERIIKTILISDSGLPLMVRFYENNLDEEAISNVITDMLSEYNIDKLTLVVDMKATCDDIVDFTLKSLYDSVVILNGKRAKDLENLTHGKMCGVDIVGRNVTKIKYTAGMERIKPLFYYIFQDKSRMPAVNSDIADEKENIDTERNRAICVQTNINVEIMFDNAFRSYNIINNEIESLRVPRGMEHSAKDYIREYILISLMSIYIKESINTRFTYSGEVDIAEKKIKKVGEIHKIKMVVPGGEIIEHIGNIDDEQESIFDILDISKPM